MFTPFNSKIGIGFFLLRFSCPVSRLLVTFLIFALQQEFALLHFELYDLGTVLCYFTLSFLFPSVLLLSLIVVVFLVLRFDLVLTLTLICAAAVLHLVARDRASASVRSRNSLPVLHIELMLMLISPCACQRRNRRALIHFLAGVHSGTALTLARQRFDGKCRMG